MNKIVEIEYIELSLEEKKLIANGVDLKPRSKLKLNLDNTIKIKVSKNKVKKYHKNTLEHWKKNAEENYITTPISVLNYITVLKKVLKSNVN